MIKLLIFILCSSLLIGINLASLAPRENAAESRKFDVFAELLGSFKIKMNKNEPIVEKLLNTLSMLQTEQNETLEKLKEVTKRLEILETTQGIGGEKGKWVSVCNEIPEGALYGGHEENGDPIYVGKVQHEGLWIPGKVTTKKVIHISHNQLHRSFDCYDILVGGRYNWVKSSFGAIVPNAVKTDDKPYYVGRVQHTTMLTIGKVDVENRKIYIPLGGGETFYREYEILVEDQLFT